MKKINKIIIYYDDGTYEEVKNSISDLQSKTDKINVFPTPIMPNPFDRDLNQYRYTCPPCTSLHDYKYTITNTSNGNVDLSK